MDLALFMLLSRLGKWTSVYTLGWFEERAHTYFSRMRFQEARHGRSQCLDPNNDREPPHARQGARYFCICDLSQFNSLWKQFEVSLIFHDLCLQTLRLREVKWPAQKPRSQQRTASLWLYHLSIQRWNGTLQGAWRVGTVWFGGTVSYMKGGRGPWVQR